MKKIAIIVVFTLLIEASVYTQTRFYLGATVAAPVTPTVNAAWNVTSGALFRMMYPSKSRYWNVSSQAAYASGQAGAVAPRKMLTQVYLSQPLKPQTISSGSTISIQIRCQKNNSAPTCNLIAYFRICNEDGSSVAEIGNASSTNMINGTPANRTISFTLGSNVVVTDRQRLIVELGGDFTSGSTTTLTAAITAGTSPNTSDLPVDNTNTTSLLPWIEFSQTLNVYLGQ